MDDKMPKLGLSDLIDQDLTSYEYYQTLPEEVRREIQRADAGSFAEMQQIAQRMMR